MTAIIPVAAAAARNSGATLATAEPVIWTFFGSPFQAGSMVAAVFGCGAARWWIGAGASLRKMHRWSVDIPVSGMALAVSAGVIIEKSPDPLYALLVGAGLGVLGEGIFALAERQIERLTGGLIAPEAGPTARPPVPAGDAESTAKLLNDIFPPKS
ncbi:hypothetical protein SAMN05192583_0537 [Sphingomonas gellani]|uniref:Uncharacterized protein n=1 Tax=Sphingomonas gellani TaxID=1166340 RepID=A0A1H7Z564_9SPHN|nr:hypothetical protein [Sphingomonas gellani]SEM53331.1 hypothetical protein SAMN05192583_0537 [Sphingomonas gellani]